MTDIQLLEKGWQKVGEHWFFSCDSGMSHQRAHTRDQAIQRTAKAVITHKNVADVWVLSPRSVDDGIEMGFIHPRRIQSLHNVQSPPTGGKEA
jgi:hypothetical protein